MNDISSTCRFLMKFIPYICESYIYHNYIFMNRISSTCI